MSHDRSGAARMRDLRGDQGRSPRSQIPSAIYLGLVLTVAGCASLKREAQDQYTTLPGEDLEDLEKARKQNARGLRSFEAGNLEKAEKHFQDALLVSPNFGPAHNNLGQVYLARHQLYLAAWEFELAANLMPERIEPFLNQGLVYELANRYERATEFYDIAYSMRPNSPEAIGNLVRLRIKQDADPLEIHHLLRELVLYDSRPDWVHWAKELLATRYRSTDEDCWDCTPNGVAVPLDQESATDAANGPHEAELLPTPAESNPLHLNQTGTQTPVPSRDLPDSRRAAEKVTSPNNATRPSDPALASFDEILRVERDPQ